MGLEGKEGEEDISPTNSKKRDGQKKNVTALVQERSCFSGALVSAKGHSGVSKGQVLRTSCDTCGHNGGEEEKCLRASNDVRAEQALRRDSSCLPDLFGSLWRQA